MKKISVNILRTVVIVSLLLQLAGCGSSQAQSTSKYGQKTDSLSENTVLKSDVDLAAQHLLVVWSDYINVLDKMYASQLWAFDYVDTYLESGDWSDLVKARTACIASARYLQELSMTEEDLSEEEYLILMNAGIDTGYQAGDFSEITGTLDNAHAIIRDQMLESLEDGVFYKSSIEYLKKDISIQRDSISYMCRYTCTETNYLLLTLGDDEIAKEYWYSMQENYPVLSMGCSDWLETEVELKAAADICLDEYEALILKEAELLSSMDAELYKMIQIIQNNDFDALAASSYTMLNVPNLLPMPIWYSSETTGYLSIVIEADGSVTYPESGDKLTDVNYGTYIQIEGISEENISAYIEYADYFAERTWKGEDNSAWYILMPDYNVMIELEDSTATIIFNGEDITFAPDWYILLQQS